jgi:alpha-glucoside transport system substrate-binding protein
MAMTTRRYPALLLVAAVAGLSVVACGTGAHRHLTVLGPWTGAEQAGFERLAQRFEDKYHIKVEYEPSRDLGTVLDGDLSAGRPPDLAVLSSQAQLAGFAKAGTVQPVGDGALAGYPEFWRSLVRRQGPTGEHDYAVVVKATAKSLIWYDPRNLTPAQRARLTSPSLTWPRLRALAAELGANPWCVALGDGSNSGWPGTDLVEDYVLHNAGQSFYQEWIDGTKPWTSPQVADAWRALRSVVSGAGTPTDVLRTSYKLAGKPMFGTPAGCYLEHSGSFVTAFYTADHARSGTDYDFVPYPAGPGSQGGVQEAAADLMAIFQDSPEARTLVSYLASAEGQRAMVESFGDGAISVHPELTVHDYPNDVSWRLAATLSRSLISFDASDSMPPVTAQVFNRKVLEYVNDPGEELTKVLTDLDEVRGR